MYLHRFNSRRFHSWLILLIYQLIILRVTAGSSLGFPGAGAGLASSRTAVSSPPPQSTSNCAIGAPKGIVPPASDCGSAFRTSPGSTLLGGIVPPSSDCEPAVRTRPGSTGPSGAVPPAEDGGPVFTTGPGLKAPGGVPPSPLLCGSVFAASPVPTASAIAPRIPCGDTASGGNAG